MNLINILEINTKNNKNEKSKEKIPTKRIIKRNSYILNIENIPKIKIEEVKEKEKNSKKHRRYSSLMNEEDIQMLKIKENLEKEYFDKKLIDDKNEEIKNDEDKEMDSFNDISIAEVKDNEKKKKKNRSFKNLKGFIKFEERDKFKTYDFLTGENKTEEKNKMNQSFNNITEENKTDENIKPKKSNAIKEQILVDIKKKKKSYNNIIGIINEEKNKRVEKINEENKYDDNFEYIIKKEFNFKKNNIEENKNEENQEKENNMKSPEKKVEKSIKILKVEEIKPREKNKSDKKIKRNPIILENETIQKKKIEETKEKENSANKPKRKGVIINTRFIEENIPSPNMLLKEAQKESRIKILRENIKISVLFCKLPERGDKPKRIRNVYSETDIDLPDDIINEIK